MLFTGLTDEFRHKARILWRIGWGDGLCRGRQSIRRGRYRWKSPLKPRFEERGELGPITESGRPLRSILRLLGARYCELPPDVVASGHEHSSGNRAGD